MNLQENIERIHEIMGGVIKEQSESKKEALKSMLNNLINDKHEEAALDLHGYMTAKMQEISGIGQAPAPTESSDEELPPVDDTIEEE